jgi:hypothetical protein
MRFAKIISLLGLLAMTAVLTNGFINGNFGEDGGALLSNPWGVVSFVDLYVGFALFSMWIAWGSSPAACMSSWRSPKVRGIG